MKGITELSIVNGQLIYKRSLIILYLTSHRGGSFAPNEPPLRTGLKTRTSIAESIVSLIWIVHEVDMISGLFMYSPAKYFAWISVDCTDVLI